jgi:16S rRNA (guanine527-N7)-methyltransferase
VDPWVLAPLGEDFEAALADGLQQLGLTAGLAGSARARRSYEAHARLLRDWNAAINLTAIRGPAEVARRHVCDSLSVVPRLTELLAPGAALLDIGSGGGYPGLPLAAALPLARTGLLDSVGKKARFLAVAAAAVRSALADDADGLRSAAAETAVPDIEAIAERAEDLAEEPEHRGTWDVVTARAVGSLAEVIELAMPLLRQGGLAVAWKREEERHGLLAELRDAGSIIRATGGGRPEVLSAEAGFLPGHRLVIVPKERPTPASYPRPAGSRRGRHR